MAQDHKSMTEGAEQYVMYGPASSVHEASAWSIKTFKGSFTCMIDRVSYEEFGKMKVTLLCTVMLFNVRIRLVGFNQILSTYIPYVSIEATLFLSQRAGM